METPVSRTRPVGPRAMTHRERLIAVFERRPLDRLPWVPDLGYWIQAERVRGTLPSRHQGPDGAHQVYMDLGACVYHGIGSWPATFTAEGVQESVEEKDGRQVKRITCDGHVLEEHRRWLPASYCHAITKYPVTDVSELAIVREIFRRRRYAPNPKANEPADRLKDYGLPVVPLPRSPLPALMADWIGVEGTVYMLADAREEMERTMAVIEEANDGFFECLDRAESPIVHFCDNLSADTITSYWDRYCDDGYRRRINQIHAVGKYGVTHLDGATKALIPKLMAAGLDGIESLTPAPVGDITIDEMARLMQPHDGVFWGGLPGAMFARPFGWDDLKDMIDGLHRLYRGGLRMIVASADLVPPDGDIESVRRVAEYLAELGA